MKKLSIHDWYYYPQCDAYIFPGKIVPVYGLEFVQALSSDHQPKPILKRLPEMSDFEARSFVSLAEEPYSSVYVKEVTEEWILAQVQTRKKDKASKKYFKYFYYKTFTPAQFSWLLKNKFDVFGWIEQGLAVTLHQAEDGVWMDVAKEVNNNAMGQARNNPNLVEIGDGLFIKKNYDFKVKNVPAIEFYVGKEAQEAARKSVNVPIGIPIINEKVFPDPNHEYLKDE